MSEVKDQGHILYPVSNRCTSFSFQINRTNHSWDMAKIVCDLEKTHPKFLMKFAKITVSKKKSPKSNRVTTMTLVTWFCYQLIAKPGNKTVTVSWPDTIYWVKIYITLLVLKLEYSVLYRSIPWLLMSWLPGSPEHQLSWYWWYSINGPLFTKRKNFNHLCQFNIEK